ncbi:MAG TPA: hypothetical protein VGL25_10310 [Casimicrobiaceae bacterium]
MNPNINIRFAASHCAAAIIVAMAKIEPTPQGSSAWTREIDRGRDQRGELHKQNREVLFENEKFVIGALQAVAGATIVAAMSQSNTIIELTSKNAFRWIVTLACVACLRDRRGVFQTSIQDVGR